MNLKEDLDNVNKQLNEIKKIVISKSKLQFLSHPFFLVLIGALISIGTTLLSKHFENIYKSNERKDEYYFFVNKTFYEDLKPYFININEQFYKVCRVNKYESVFTNIDTSLIHIRTKLNINESLIDSTIIFSGKNYIKFINSELQNFQNNKDYDREDSFQKSAILLNEFYLNLRKLIQ